MGYAVLIEVISQVLNIFEDNHIVFIVDAGEQTFEALATLELNVDFVGKKLGNWRYTHYFNYIL